jgi:hypothetical protein
LNILEDRECRGFSAIQLEKPLRFTVFPLVFGIFEVAHAISPARPPLNATPAMNAINQRITGFPHSA